MLVLTAVLLAGATAHGASDPANDLPMLGDTSSGIVSPELEARLGQDFLRQVRANLPTTSDPLMVYWTELLLLDLAVASELRQPDLSMVLIDSSAINAFAAPGGIVGINLGTFAEAPSVHEFSAILAHELAHLSQRHFARGIEEQRKTTLPMLAAMLASAALMATVGSDVGLATLAGSQAVAQQNQLRYSRAREREADRVGIRTLARADMDPQGMALMFARMQEVSRFQRRPPEFLLTHPVTESRIADAREQASEYPRRTYEDSREFELMRARVRVHLASTPQEAAQAFRAQMQEGRTRHPDVVRYGLALALLEQGRVDEAEATLAPLLGPDQSLAFTLAEVDIALARNDSATAISRLEQELRFSSENLPLAAAYAKALSQAHRYEEAQKVLERLSVRRPNDAQVWYELAETAGLAGDIVAVHRARAEYFQLHGNLQNALQHLSYALQLVENDYPMTARLNQRVQDIRELRQRLNS